MNPKSRKEERVKKGSMHYRRLGRTGLDISEISLGGSPIPEWPILIQAIERGVNYIDTSHVYQNGNSERQIGRLFAEVGRDTVFVGTKFHLRQNWNRESILQTVEGSLRRLQTETIDVLLIHGASKQEDLTDERVLSAYDQLKKEGKCRFTGISCHSNHHKVVGRAIECGHYDVIQLGYNVFDIAESEKSIEAHEDYLGASGIRHLIALAKKNDVGIIAMKALKVGGRRQNLGKYGSSGQSIFQIMLKWALENPNIASVVTEMLTFDQLEEDLAVTAQELSADQKTALYRYIAENSQDFCHMCGTCESKCPSGIKTTAILRYLAYYEGYEKHEHAKLAYRRLKPHERAPSCNDCGQCETVCPYGVSVRRRILHAHSLLC
ncbi:MAG: aldo/keto reductase [Candidatus Aminicenantes bacterium]|nr:aldo/keto reductase [Candidatus Aminicenantes bacterium]